MSVKEEILKERNKEPFPFYGFSIAVLSLCYGIFLIIFGDYMNTLLAELFEIIPDWPISLWLVVGSVINLIGIRKRDKKLKRIGIVLLSAVWTAIAAVYIVFGFTTGYPNPTFLFMIFIVAVCYRLSKKGDFG